MMLELNTYQKACLKSLSDYLRAVSQRGRADTPFSEMTGRDYLSSTLPETMRSVPYVCLRVPTGGGKTFIAAHALPIVPKELLRTEHSVVLWLAPSRTIVDQTRDALRDRRHPYRRVLDEKLGGKLEVLSLGEALSVTRGTLDSTTTIIVSTMQALRVQDTDGRKVYDQNGSLMSHFSGLTEQQMAPLERHEDGGPIYSLANVLRLRRPVVIVDEAHNARTPLSFETLDRLSPSCVVEFTATPDQEKNPSNVLHAVSAMELKAADMVKLPIRLVNRPEWRDAVQAAIAQQQNLEKLAIEEEKQTGEYIRPIVLFQAEANRKTGDPVTVEVLLDALVKDFGIPREQIAVRTGQTDELDDHVLTRESEHRFVITVQALREGWDCPFAYVLCSVSNMSSPTAVEQILGRVLRLPGAKLKKHEELNRSYAIVTSSKFSEAASALTEILANSGFERYEARALIERGTQQGGSAAETLFDSADDVWEVAESFTVAPKSDALPQQVREHLSVVTPMTSGGPIKVVYRGPAMTKETTAALKAAFDSDDDREAAERLGRKSRGESVSPAALDKAFEVPRLAVRVDGQIEIFEDQFRDVEWKLSDQDASLTTAEFRLAADPSSVGEIYLDDDKGKFRIRELHEQLLLLNPQGPRTATELAVWLDHEIKHPDIPKHDAMLYFRKMIDALLEERECSIEDLSRSRFRLRDAAELKVAGHRLRVMRESYQHTLDGTGELAVEIDPAVVFSFPLNVYPARTFYEGPVTFQKHFYDVIEDMNKEEVECARLIDGLKQVEYWVRNIDRHPQCSFGLPTSTDMFYPDFVALLKDGRVLCVEYKGGDRISNDDSKEKKMVGELWEARSNGRCLFRLVGKDDMDGQIRDAVEA